MDTSPNAPVEQTPVAKTANPILRLVALVIVLVGLALVFYGLYAVFIRRPFVPPGVPPLSEVPLLDPNKTVDILAQGIATSTTVADTSVAMAEPPAPPTTSPPPKTEPTTVDEPAKKPETPKPTVTSSQKSQTRAKSAARSVRSSKSRSTKQAASKRKSSPTTTKKPAKAKQTPTPSQRPRERVPSAFEQLMRTRAARSQATGVSIANDGAPTIGVATRAFDGSTLFVAS